MKQVKQYFAFIILALMLVGCANQPTRITPAPSATAGFAEQTLATAQESIAQGIRGLLNAQKLLDAEISLGVLSKQELSAIQASLKRVREALVEANEAVKTGNLAEALAKGSSADALADVAENYLTKRLAERRKKQ
jgi:hypothetical protein